MALKLGATIRESEDGWTHAEGFPSAEVAWYFRIEFNGMESSGPYPSDYLVGYSVQFRS